MAHPEQQQFLKSVKAKFPEKFKGVDVLDVGSLDINGNCRFLFENCTYTGIDLGKGPNVDIVSKGHEFNPGKQYDVVISCECFEHDQHWAETIMNCIRLTKSNGLFIFTCAYDGRHEHGTKRTTPQDSPFSHVIFSDYYMNLNEHLVQAIPGFVESFIYYGFSHHLGTRDLYFFGLKQ